MEDRKNKGILRRGFTFLVALAMMLTVLPMLPVTANAAEDPNVHVLEASALTPFDGKTEGQIKKDGDSEVVADYFTILWRSSSKVETSEKSWEDGYTSTNRINIAAVKRSSDEIIGGAIKFKTNGPATLKVWWMSNQKDMFVENSAGTKIATTKEDDKTKQYIFECELPSADTYYLANDGGTNYIYKVEITETPAEVKHVFESKGFIKEFAAESKSDGEEEKYDDYFTLIWSKNSKGDQSGKTWDDGYKTESSDYRVNFGGKVETSKNALRFKTSGPATVTIWWAQGGNDNREMAILDSEGKAAAVTTGGTYTKNNPYKSELKLTEAGTYYLGGYTGNNYIFKVEVTEGGGAKPPRGEWSAVAEPVIKEVKLNEDKSKIDVTVTAIVGNDGGDKVTIIMSDAEGKELETQNSSAEAAEHTKTFTPGASGTYTFTAKLVREGETDKTTAQGTEFKFSLPLTAPNIKGVYNNGDGSVTVEWDAVKEATGYRVTAGESSQDVTELSAKIADLKAGDKVTVKVAALRGEEVGPESTAERTVADRADLHWSFVAFGPSVSKSKNTYSGDANDGEVTVVAKDNGGKLQNTVDGLGFYYTKVPTDKNFTLTATAKVNNWTYSNGQEGFGIMASDSIGEAFDSGNFYNNSYMAIVSKVEYYWDTENDRFSENTGTKASMYLGIGAREIVGITSSSSNVGLKYSMYPLEHSAIALGGGSYNIVDNVTNPDSLAKKATTVDSPISEFKFTIQKNNTGYFVSYTDASGHTETKKYYDTTALDHLDEEYVYVGFFAARLADITFTDISLTTVDPADDDPAEERPIEYLDPSYSVVSSVNSAKADYKLGFYGNADGVITVTGADGTVIADKTAVKANVKTYVDVTLTSGANTFTVVMDPDESYRPNGEYSAMRDYDNRTITFTVTYEADTRETVYVGPNASASGAGTRENPTTIYEAVKKATPGQIIVLLPGYYSLSSTVLIQRGIDGTADKPITLTADPESDVRPVLDFNRACEGLVLAGSHWKLYGFDVTNSQNSKDGIRVSGSDNVLERLLTYKNGNTGIQISRYAGSDLHEEWPANNLIKNCSSYLNADSGYEDADGFAAKLTIGEGNVFDGCISAYNADDGWDLFAKLDTGKIGAVTIRNCIAFKNGYVLDDEGNEINAGNGNGFKMGGSNMFGGHKLINSISFGNKAKGFDSNSCPDIKVTNSTAFDNENYNVAMYTNDDVVTKFGAQGIISYKKSNSVGENLKPRTQTEDSLRGTTNYYFDGSRSVNSEGREVTDEWFVSLDMDKAIEETIRRNEDGTINMGGFLELTDSAAADAGARLPGDQTEGVRGESQSAEKPAPAPSVPTTPAVSDSNKYTVPDTDATYTLPVEVEAGDGRELDITVSNGGETTVEVPVKDAGYGTVAVIVHEDGTEEIIPDCCLTEDGVAFQVDGSATVRIEDRSIDFTDMANASDWSRDAVDYVSARGLLTGTGTDTFSPGKSITRGMAATVLFRLANTPEAGDGTFTDVSEGRYFTEAVAWAAENEVVTGYGDGTFKPSENITREQLATIIYRFAKLRGLDMTVSETLEDYGDAASVSRYAREAMAWCVENGIIDGVSDDTLSPRTGATRAQAAAMIMRLCQLMGK